MCVSIPGILIFAITKTSFHVMTKNNVHSNYVLHHKTFRKRSSEGFADGFSMKEKFESYIGLVLSLCLMLGDRIEEGLIQTQFPQFPGAPEK